MNAPALTQPELTDDTDALHAEQRRAWFADTLLKSDVNARSVVTTYVTTYSAEHPTFDLDGLRDFIAADVGYDRATDEGKRRDRSIAHALSHFARERDVPLLRVGSVNSGRYRVVQPGEDLRALKSSQVLRKVGRSVAKKSSGRKRGTTTSRPNPDGSRTVTTREVTMTLTPLTALCGRGECLTVLDAKDDAVLVQASDGRVFKALLERVLL